MCATALGLQTHLLTLDKQLLQWGLWGMAGATRPVPALCCAVLPELSRVCLPRWYVTYGHELIWKNREPLVKLWHEMRTQGPRKGGGSE